MGFKDLLVMYITILIGVLTTATIVVTLLKEEMLGKSFREVIKSIELKKGDAKLKKFMIEGTNNLCIYVIVLVMSIPEKSHVNEFIDNDFELCKYVILFLLIIHLGNLMYRVFTYFLDIYNKILDVNIGSTNWESKDEAWKKVVLDFIIDSKDPNHYDIIKKNMKPQGFGGLVSDFFKEDKIEAYEGKELNHYLCKKRVLFIKEYLKYSESLCSLDGVDFELIGYNYDGILKDICINSMLERASKKEKLPEYMRGITRKIKFLLQNQVSIEKVILEIKKVIKSFDTFSYNGEFSLLLVQEFLENIIQYPEFIKYNEINNELMSLIDNDDISSYFMGYCEIVGDNELIETYKNEKGKNFSNLPKDKDMYQQGRKGRRIYLKRANKENFSDLPKDNDMYQEGRKSGSIYLNRVNKEPEKETYITRWIENLSQDGNTEFEELNNRLGFFDQLQKDEVKKCLVASGMENVEFTKHPNIDNLLNGTSHTAVLIEKIVCYFAKDEGAAKEILKTAKKDERIIEMATGRGGDFNYIWVTKTTPFKGIRFLKENPDAKNKKITNYDHVYFAADKEGNIIGSEGITHFGGNENNEYPKKGRISRLDFQNKYQPKTLSAEKILGDANLETSFMGAINEILSNDAWKNNCDNK